MKIVTSLRCTYAILRKTKIWSNVLSHKVIVSKWALNSNSQFSSVAANLISKEGGISSPYAPIRIPDFPLSHYMLQKMTSYGDGIALVNGLTGENVTYTELCDKIIKVASALVKSGLRKGDVLAVFSPNCVEYAMIYLGAIAAGGVVSTLNPLYTAYELQHALHESASKFVVCSETLVPIAQQVRTSCPSIKEVIVIGSAEGCRPFKSLLEDDGKAFPDNLDFNVYKDLAVLPFSSGTTGLPKGVMLTHNNLVSNIEQMGTKDVLGYDQDDIFVAVLPFYHIYGQVVILLTGLSAGSRTVVLPRFQSDSYLNAVDSNKATFLHVVPPVILFLAKHPLVAKYEFSSVHTIFTGAAPVGAEVVAEAVDKIKVPRFRQGYGLTEASPVTHSNPKENYKYNTIGFAIHNTEYKIVDINTGISLPQGKEGELCVRGPQIMAGYFNNPTATAHTVRNGWLHTGDIGYYDKDGHVVISDRLKELIKYKGYQVAPAELEALLVTHPAILDAAVIGKPDSNVGELPRAYVVFKPNKKASVEEIQQFVADRLAPYKQLRGGVEVRNEIPKSASGKIMRRYLKDELLGKK